jgi:hypothetical protein
MSVESHPPGFECTLKDNAERVESGDFGNGKGGDYASSCYCNRMMVKAMMSVMDEGIR